jgi:CBS domain containing-hemolysin-like protein
MTKRVILFFIVWIPGAKISKSYISEAVTLIAAIPFNCFSWILRAVSAVSLSSTNFILDTF